MARKHRKYVPRTKRCELCRAPLHARFYQRDRGRCSRCRIEDGELDEVGREIAIKEHLDWLIAAGSLRAALASRDCDGPLRAWADCEHVREVALRHALHGDAISKAVKAYKAAQRNAQQ